MNQNVLGHFCTNWGKPGLALPKTIEWMCVTHSRLGPMLIWTHDLVDDSS